MTLLGLRWDSAGEESLSAARSLSSCRAARNAHSSVNVSLRRRRRPSAAAGRAITAAATDSSGAAQAGCWKIGLDRRQLQCDSVSGLLGTMCSYDDAESGKAQNGNAPFIQPQARQSDLVQSPSQRGQQKKGISVLRLLLIGIAAGSVGFSDSSKPRSMPSCVGGSRIASPQPALGAQPVTSQTQMHVQGPSCGDGNVDTA